MNRFQRIVQGVLFLCLACMSAGLATAQSLGNAGTVQGTVTDPSGAAIPSASVTLLNPVTGYQQTVNSDIKGAFRLINIPPNTYRLSVAAHGFSNYSTSLTVRNAVPIQVTAKLELPTSETTVNVSSGGSDLVENESTAHVDVDRNQILKLPAFDPGSGLSQAITYSTGGVAADSNGSFHPLGDHAQVSFVVDGQPISDQQSKVFSTQLPTSAIQSMELVTGAPSAEFGDKTSLVDQITTRSGLGSMRQFGSLEAFYGSFGSPGVDASYGYGTEKFGNFIAIDGTRSGRFLDSPEFTPFHDTGNNQTIFDRLDWQPSPTNVYHLNLFTARNWTQVPNSYDQLSQDQRQRVLTWNVAPGYQHTFNANTLLTVNTYARKDQFDYYPSRDVFADTPSTQSQSRQLFNYGVNTSLAITEGRHSIKIGVDAKQTRLIESFNFGITDPTFNAVCNTTGGDPVADPAITNPDTCASAGFVANPNLQTGLIPFDLSRHGRLFLYRATHNVNQYGVYIQDAITMGNLLLSVGIRGDAYYGLASDGQAQPRVGLSYNIKQTNTVLRVAYSRTMETPFNENLLLSSASGLNNGTADSVLGINSAPPIEPGHRNQFNAGFQQAIGKYLLVDADYFWKFTHNSYDFSTLQNTTITFPIAWNKSKIDGFTGRLSTTNIHGFTGYWTFGHTRARYFPPQSGGLLNTSAVPPGVFRIDHDQEFQSNVVGRYQRPHNGEYVEFTWRYDSGLVVSGVPDVASALTLTAPQQVDIGLTCDGVAATLANPFTPASPCNVGRSALLTLPQTGTQNDDHNPNRVKPRNIFNVGIGTDNLLHREGQRRITASLQIDNLTNKVALYNFLSTFSGTHFLQPRTLVARLGYVF